MEPTLEKLKVRENKFVNFITIDRHWENLKEREVIRS